MSSNTSGSIEHACKFVENYYDETLNKTTNKRIIVKNRMRDVRRPFSNKQSHGPQARCIHPSFWGPLQISLLSKFSSIPHLELSSTFMSSFPLSHLLRTSPTAHRYCGPLRTTRQLSLGHTGLPTCPKRQYSRPGASVPGVQPSPPLTACQTVSVDYKHGLA
jgi:hypothetical protein